MAEKISTVGIVGVGTMGSHIVQALGDSVTVVTADSLDTISQLSECDLVIDTTPEDLEARASVLSALDDVVRDDAIIAIHALALDITSLAVATKQPERVLGLVFSNPIENPGVQLIATAATDPAVSDQVEEFVTSLDKKLVRVGDRPGFVGAALILPYINQAIGMFESQYATREDIDAAMRFGCGLPVGPLQMADAMGIDTLYDALSQLHEVTFDHRMSPAPILKQMIAAGHLGAKSGRGFYSYESAESSTVVDDELTPASGGTNAAVREVKNVGVVGTGTMATGIVEVFAKGGYNVTFVGRSQDKIDNVVSSITKSMDRAIAKGRATEKEKAEVFSRLNGATERDALSSVDLVVEAIAEDLAIKQELFDDLDRICKDGAILATTTSSLPIGQLASRTKRPGDVVGMHFFNPAQVMKLVEVVSTVQTADDVAATCTELSKKLGKVPVSCADRAGFIVNALLFPYLNDAITMVETHYASIDDIDAVITNGFKFPMGPFALLDVVGLDVSLAIQEELFAEFGESTFAPAQLLEQLVEAKFMGRKTGRGFRVYTKK